MVKIASGHSNYGGSTTAFINLCNLFNKNGIECVFYGKHKWHLDKCRSALLTDFCLNRGDSMICHYIHSNSLLDLEKRCRRNLKESKSKIISRLADMIFPKRSKELNSCVLSCHEKEVFPLQNTNYRFYDEIHYVSEEQRKWHQVNHPYFICANVLDDLKANAGKPSKVAGIIGTIDPNKQVHVSIQRALDDGMERILIYGSVTDQDHYQHDIEPLLKKYPDIIKYMGYSEDKQSIYDSVSHVYHSSISETWGYIKGECELTGTLFHGNSSTDGYYFMSNDDILNLWVKKLNL